MQQRFHLFVRQHANDWYTAEVLTHPQYAAFGPDLNAVRGQIAEVLAHDLAEGHLAGRGVFFHADLVRRSLEVELQAVQQKRLIQVPMRLTLLERPLKADGEGVEALDAYEITLPRLGKRFQILGRENITAWAQEVVRDFFHLKPVEELLAYQYERGERVEPLDVSFSGKALKGGSKRARKARRRRQSANSEVSDVWAQIRAMRHGVLDEVGMNLTEEARADRLPRAFLRDAAVGQLLSTLSGGGGRSTLLIGPSGAGKTAIVHEACHRIAKGLRLPALLEDAPIWHVTGSRIVAGMRYLGEWQERALEVVEAIQAAHGILYVDNPLELMMAGDSQDGMSVASCLTPFIRAGEITVLAECTPDTLVLAEQMDPTFIGALRRQVLPALSPEQAFQILSQRAELLGRTYKTRFTEVALARALDLLARFGDAGALPGSGLSLIEQMARLGKEELTPRDAVVAFSRASGFPEGLVDPDALLDLDGLRGFFAERVIGQPQVIDRLVHLVSVIKAGLNDPQKPLGSFLFAGPTGVGKTESALTLAEYLFGDRDRLVRLDMSEYGYPGSAARLVGGARGEGELTRKLRQQPFCVLLLDELEKAEPAVFDLLLQALGEGRLTDGTGRTASLRHAIVILTSNLGAARQRSIGVTRPTGGGDSRYLDAARAFFRPEFLNRIDHLVPFGALDAPAITHIARRMLDKALGRDGLARREITVTYDEEILELLMTHGFDPRYGARPMKRAIEQRVLIPLSRRLAMRHGVQRDQFELYVHDGRVEVMSTQPVGARSGAVGSDVLRLTEPVLTHEHLWRRHVLALRGRLQGWSESQLARTLRGQSDHPLHDRLAERVAALDALASEPGIPAEAARAFTEALVALEWDLCLAALPRRDEITLEIYPLHPEGRDYCEGYVEQLGQWARAQGFGVQEAEGAEWRISGPYAGTCLMGEVGLHRVHGEGGAFDVQISAEEDAGQSVVVRELTGEPESLWDPRTGVEIAGGLGAMASGMRVLLIGSMSMRVR